MQGKQAITKAHRRRFQAIQQIGCLACRAHGLYEVPPDVHHLTSAGRRRGHDYTVGLCPWHHRGIGVGPGDSLARSPRAFRLRYGGDDFLLEEQNRLIEAYELQTTHGSAR